MKPDASSIPTFCPGEDFLFLFMPPDAEGGEQYLATLRDGKAVNPTLLMKNDTAASYTPAGGGPRPVCPQRQPLLAEIGSQGPKVGR